jgi:hypothetical protein
MRGNPEIAVQAPLRRRWICHSLSSSVIVVQDHSGYMLCTVTLTNEPIVKDCAI